MVKKQKYRKIDIAAFNKRDKSLQSERLSSRFYSYRDCVAQILIKTDLQKKNPRRQARVVLGGAQHATARESQPVEWMARFYRISKACQASSVAAPSI